jgi:hypothetical protein
MKMYHIRNLYQLCLLHTVYNNFDIMYFEVTL